MRTGRPRVSRDVRDHLPRFWGYVQKDGENGCWNWTGPRNNYGYGAFRIGRLPGLGAHRVSYELAHGVRLTPDQILCHTCDNRLCINPAHLWIGTHADNHADCVAKGRNARGPALSARMKQLGKQRGIRNGAAVLNEHNVQQIRAMLAAGRKPAHIARHFEVSHACIYGIRVGKAWSWLPSETEAHSDGLQLPLIGEG